MLRIEGHTPGPQVRHQPAGPDSRFHDSALQGLRRHRVLHLRRKLQLQRGNAHRTQAVQPRHVLPRQLYLREIDRYRFRPELCGQWRLSGRAGFAQSEFGARPVGFRHPPRVQHELRIPVAGTGTAYSGQPLTPQLSGPSNDLAQATRPDRLSNGALDNPTANLWYSPAAFAIVPDSVFRYGNSGRNILDGPGSTAINISLSKWFQLAERAKAQFRWEAFNTTNHSNLSLPAVNLDKSNAGTITKARAARVMQVGVRYQFRTDNDDPPHA